MGNQVGSVIWITCRAKSGCPGRNAEIKMIFKLPGGGTSIRYRCQTCNGSFHVTF